MADSSYAFQASMETGKFRSGAEQMQRVASSTSAGVASAFAKIAVAAAGIGAAILAARSAFGAFSAAIEMGGALNDLSARTGESAGNLLLLQRAFKNAGAGADSVGPVINRLQRAIVEAGEGGKQQSEAFNKLGLDFEKLKRLTPLEQLKAVAGALQGVKNDSERTAIAMQLLGRSGGELVPMLRAMGTELDTARKQLGSAPAIIDATNQALDTIGDNFGAIGEKGREFALGVLSKIAPALADITTRIAEIDAAGLGVMISRYIRDFGEWASASMGVSGALDNIKAAIEGIQKGNFGDALKTLVLTARDLAMSALNEIWRVAVSMVSSLGETIARIFRSGGPLMSAINILFSWMAARIRQLVNEAIYEAPVLLGGGKRRNKAIAEEFGMAAESLQSAMPNAAALVGNDIVQQASRFGDRFQYAMANTGDIFDMDGRRAETAAMAEKARGTSIEGLRAQYDELMREPASAERAAEEAKLVDKMRELHRAMSTPQAVKDAEAGKTTDDETASETTLQKAVAALESLNNKLPMPALV